MPTRTETTRPARARQKEKRPRGLLRISVLPSGSSGLPLHHLLGVPHYPIATWSRAQGAICKWRGQVCLYQKIRTGVSISTISNSSSTSGMNIRTHPWEAYVPMELVLYVP